MPAAAAHAQPDLDARRAVRAPLDAPEVNGTHALDTRNGRLMLLTCGTTKTRWVTRSWGWSGASLSGNRVSWTETRWVAGGAAVRARVRTLDVTTGRVRSWAFGDKPELYVVHTRLHIFVDDGPNAGYVRRYAIDL